MKFESFGLNPKLLEGLEAMGFFEATPIQEQALPIILDKKDLIACAQTGTGKTAAFLLPVIHQIMQNNNPSNSIKVLVVVPTRELALQIDRSLEGLSYFTDMSSCSLYGGGDGSEFAQQKTALTTGTDFVIATPGKLISHLSLGYVNTKDLTHLILDEADRMLDMGFYEDLMRIVSFLPKERQTLMFSATMPSKIRQLAQTILKDPEQISLSMSKPAAGVMQVAYLVHDKDKTALITKLLNKEGLHGVIVFSRTKRNVKEIAKKLKKTGLQVEEMHSDLTQDAREEVMRQFRNKNINILVATDILARGIDIKELQLVLNFDVPDEAEDYVHRVGRTARADQTGMAITFITPSEQRKFAQIEKLIETNVLKQPVPPDIGESFVYDPNSKERSPNRGGGNRGGGNRSGGRSGGNRSGGFKRKGDSKGKPREGGKTNRS
ncbi:DEAD/DEAH box helicase [Cryomorpha ignava]|uniref:DEAD/DEAH box helicase n=1 Tax=Cryomorpha ignava TaxID=101383 RepID=A0A7K3WLY5_9FLAO|nr:DEAD/DEAH box helicase [Cryomorpha ignava]NEN22663.1 DEAD/DEAH box helicase [Cryomorpha ignava]